MSDGTVLFPVEYEHAKIVREMIQHENNLQNYRITWLVTIQGLMLAGLGFAWDKQDARALVIVFAILGIIVALSCWAALRLGSKAFKELDQWWNDKKGTYPGPPVIGHKAPIGGIMWYLRPWRLMPWIFVIGWSVIFVVVVVVVRSDGNAKSTITINQERQLDTFKADFK